jgi:undecaprenyl diphosphate synthase
MEDYKQKIDPARLPRHIAVIMDGNGRWAEERGEDRLFGHYHGVESVREVVEGCAELQVGYLTLYAFSTENWDRPAQEVMGLMELLVENIRQEVPRLLENNIRLASIGHIQELPANARLALEEAIQATAHCTGMTLIIALSYSSRWEILEAVKQISTDVKEGKLEAGHIDNEVFTRYLATRHYPDPELMIRTSGEHRISNFLMYQLAYAELYFTNTLWPDFRRNDLYKAIVDFQKRQRRFGKTGKQIAQSGNRP